MKKHHKNCVADSKENYNREKYQSLVDPIPNYMKKHHKNCVADSKENYK